MEQIYALPEKVLCVLNDLFRTMNRSTEQATKSSYYCQKNNCKECQGDITSCTHNCHLRENNYRRIQRLYDLQNLFGSVWSQDEKSGDLTEQEEAICFTIETYLDMLVESFTEKNREYIKDNNV